MNNKSEKKHFRQDKLFKLYMHFTADILYVKWKNNNVPDSLARKHLYVMDTDVSTQVLIADEQKSDSSLKKLGGT